MHLLRRPGRDGGRDGGWQVVLLHGLGADEQDLMGLAEELDPDVAVVTPRAPLPYGPGYSWFPIEFEPDGTRRIDDRAAVAARDFVASWLPRLAEQTGVPAERTVLGGFSQGGMLALGVLASHPHLAAGGAVFSGHALPFLLEGAADRLPPFFVAHGEFDPVLSVECGRAVRKALEGRAETTYLEYPMPHAIVPEELDDFRAWFERLQRKAMGTKPAGVP